MTKAAKANPFARTYGTKLLEPPSPAQPASEPVTRHYDVVLYELTRELEYLEGDESMAFGDRESIAEGKRRAARMKAAIKTVADFETAGGAEALAEKYGISVQAAKRYLVKLQKEEQWRAAIWTRPEPAKPAPVPEPEPERPEEPAPIEPDRTETPKPTEPEDEALELSRRLLNVVLSLAKTQAYVGVKRYFLDSIADAEAQAAAASTTVERLAGQMRAEMLRQIQDELGAVLAGDST